MPDRGLEVFRGDPTVAQRRGVTDGILRAGTYLVALSPLSAQIIESLLDTGVWIGLDQKKPIGRTEMPVT